MPYRMVLVLTAALQDVDMRETHPMALRVTMRLGLSRYTCRAGKMLLTIKNRSSSLSASNGADGTNGASVEELVNSMFALLI